jgi:hypothetical protein
MKQLSNQRFAGPVQKPGMYRARPRDGNLQKNTGNAMYIICEISLRVFYMDGSVNWFYSVGPERQT